jgi:hypothetical protein
VYLLEPERGPDDTKLEVRGGCQSDAVRYVARVEDDEAYYCHCRMCQKAFGNLFGAYFFALGESVRWESAEPAYFHSSNIARRGFCRECGTPLSFEYLGSEEIHLTVGSLDEPGRLRPVAHYDDGMPRSRIDDDTRSTSRSGRPLMGRTQCQDRCWTRPLELCWKADAESSVRTSSEKAPSRHYDE